MIDLAKYIYESTNKHIHGLHGYDYDEVCDIVRDTVESILGDNDMDGDIEIIDVQLHGSRLRGDHKETSDLDAVVEYDGDIKEYALFNILHDAEYSDMFTIDGITIDVNPIRECESGNMKEYMKKSHDYDKSKMSK